MEDEEEKTPIDSIAEKITFEQLEEKCRNGEIDINSPVKKVWVSYYLSGSPYEQAMDILKGLLDSYIINMVEINPLDLYEKVYFINNNKDEEPERKDDNDVILIFKDNTIDEDKLKEVYEDTLDNFSIASYMNEHSQLMENREYGEYESEYDKMQKEQMENLKEEISKKLNKSVEDVTEEDIIAAITEKQNEYYNKEKEKFNSGERKSKKMSIEDLKKDINDRYYASTNEVPWQRAILNQLDTDNEKLAAKCSVILSTHLDSIADVDNSEMDEMVEFKIDGGLYPTLSGLNTLNDLTYIGCTVKDKNGKEKFAIVYEDETGESIRFYVPEGNNENEIKKDIEAKIEIVSE